MHRHLRPAAAAVLALATIAVAAPHRAQAAGAAEGRYIVQFRDEGPGRAAVSHAGGRVVLDLPHAAAVRLPEAALAALARNPAIAFVEPDQPRFLSAQSTPYGIDLVQAPQAWSGASASAVKVCIVDSGVDGGHEDLPTGSMTGTPADWNQDGCGHGTHVAGTIAALDNARGVVGANPGGLALHMVRVFDDSCNSAWASSLVAAVQACRDAGAKVVNMSLGGPGHSTYEANAFRDLYEQDGLLLVAAAGNDGSSGYSYPASYDAVISVAAVDDQESRASFSQHNDQVELSAPGVRVLSTYPGSQYGYMSGTSMATPHVTGAAALVWSHDPTWTNVQIREALDATAKDLGAAGRDADYGYGLVHAAAALQHLGQSADHTPPAVSVSPVRDGQVEGAAVRVSATATDAAGVASVTLFHRAPGESAFARVPLTRGSGDRWTGEIPGGAVTTAGVEYYVQAVDASPAANRRAVPEAGAAAPFAFTALPADTTAPTIQHQAPTGPVAEGTPIDVRATVTDASGVAAAVLHYEDADGAWAATPLQPGGGVFNGRIPAGAVLPPEVAYWIEAEDGVGNAASLPPAGELFTVPVARADRQAPAIRHAPVPSVVEAGRPVEVVAEVTDASGVASVSLLWRPQGATEFAEVEMVGGAGDTYAAEIPADAVTAEGVEYYLRAVDASPQANAAVAPAGAPDVPYGFVGGEAASPPAGTDDSATAGGDAPPTDGQGPPTADHTPPSGDAPPAAEDADAAPDTGGLGCASGAGGATGTGLWMVLAVALAGGRRRGLRRRA